MYIYAADLVKMLKKVWKQTKLYVQEEAVPPLPGDAELRRLLDVAYHASLLTEEGRHTRWETLSDGLQTGSLPVLPAVVGYC